MAHTGEQTDQSLLRDYVDAGSEEAFQKLVERYAGMVHAAARRQVRDPTTADDVTQAVFILLARKASSLTRPALLPGWLVKTTHFACRDAIKREGRRKCHERRAAAMNPPNADEGRNSPANSISGGLSDDVADADEQAAMRSVLDDALARLRESDRAAVTLRYLQGRSISQVAAAIGVSEAAAGKRVERALAKLRAFFRRHDVTPSAAGAGIAGVLLAESAKAAAYPPILTAKIGGAAVAAMKGVVAGAAAGATPAALSIAKGSGDLMTIAKIKSVVALLALAAGIAGGGVVLVHHAWAQTVPAAANASSNAIGPAPAPAASLPLPQHSFVTPPPGKPVIPALPPATMPVAPAAKPATPARPPAPVTPPAARPLQQITPPAPTANPVDQADGVGGVVRLEGKPPEMGVIDMSGVPQCQSQHAGQVVHEETVVVGKDGGLANVVVSIIADDGTVLPEPKVPAQRVVTLDQTGCLYHPHVIALQKGSKLMLQNSDPFLHNVHSQSENAPFNFAQPMIGKKASPVLKEPECFHIKCDVHPWMSAWIAVLDNPYFAVTDENGHFTLPAGLPDGDYKVRAWHEKYDMQEGRVTVSHGRGIVNFTFKSE